MKKVKWIVLGIVVLIVVAIVGVWLALDGIVRSTVETQATDSLNLQTTLGSANVSLLGGSVGLNDLQIASPQGFAAPRMFTLGGVKVGASLGNLRNDPIGVDQIVIDKPKLVIEQSGGKFNFQALMDEQSKRAPDSGQPGDGKRDESEPIRLIIRDLAVNDAQVVIRPGVPGLQNEINVPIPSFSVKDIGTGEGNKNGAAIKEVVMLTVTELVKKAGESNALPPELKQLLSLNADQLKGRIVSEVNKQAEKIGADLTRKVTNELGQGAGKAIEQGIGGLLRQSGPSTRPR